MKYGIDLPPYGPFASARVLADVAREAEQAGWDGFFIWDHVARAWKIDIVDTWVALAAMAMTTQRIRLGPLVTPLPRRRPWKVAREAVSLDHLSNGRLILGVGLGTGRPPEWANFNEQTDAKKRGEMVDEALDVLTGLWRGESFSYDGQFYQVKDSTFTPRPVQQPRIPIWTGGYWPNKKPFRRAARWDGAYPLEKDSAHPWGGPLPEQVREVAAFIQEQRQSDAPFDIVCRGEPTPGADPARGAAMVAPYAEAGATWWIEAVHPWAFGRDWEDVWPFTAMRERIRQGPPKV